MVEIYNLEIYYCRLIVQLVILGHHDYVIIPKSDLSHNKEAYLHRFMNI